MSLLHDHGDSVTSKEEHRLWSHQVLNLNATLSFISLSAGNHLNFLIIQLVVSYTKSLQDMHFEMLTCRMFKTSKHLLKPPLSVDRKAICCSTSCAPSSLRLPLLPLQLYQVRSITFAIGSLVAGCYQPVPS